MRFCTDFKIIERPHDTHRATVPRGAARIDGRERDLVQAVNLEDFIFKHFDAGVP